jgi:hypothetical protein
MSVHVRECEYRVFRQQPADPFVDSDLGAGKDRQVYIFVAESLIQSPHSDANFIGCRTAFESA